MKHTEVINNLEIELSGIELVLSDLKNDLTDPMLISRELKATKELIEKSENLAKQYKSAIRALTLLDELKEEDL